MSSETGNVEEDASEKVQEQTESKEKNTLFKAPTFVSKKKHVEPKQQPPPPQDKPLQDESMKKIQFADVRSVTIPASIYKPFQPLQSQIAEKEQNKPAAPSMSFKMDRSQKLELNNPVEEMLDDDSEKPKKSISKVKAAPAVLEYQVPTWSETSKDVEGSKYSLEVLKEGSIVGKLDLGGKNHVVFGRLKPCDFMLEHPSISRHHAILQYGSPDENAMNVELQKDGSSGWYVYDLGSTHGSIINKARVKAKTYYRIKVGHMVKFGGSSRIYILQGPDEDQEEEAKESATELRERARAAKLKQENLNKIMMGEDSSSDEDDEGNKKQRTQNQNNNADEEEDTGVTWGMLEDAVAEEDDSDEEKSSAAAGGDKELLAHMDKSRFYYKDPHKAIKHFFEKEGIDINFECKERRPGQWAARLELPITSSNGKVIYAEATCTGKRVQAVNNCALEACQILDRHGMFEESKNSRKKGKEWEKDDFYDSDEDCYLDRTGDLDLKREQRKRRYGKNKYSQGGAETYESLVAKLKEHQKEISEIESKLEKDRQVTKVKGDCEDSLQAFMRNIKEGRALDSNTRSKLKIRLLQLRKDVSVLQRLAEIARPTHLPPLQNLVAKPMSLMARMLGKRKTQQQETNQKGELNPPPAMQLTKTEDNDEVEEEDDDEEDNMAENISSPPVPSVIADKMTTDSPEKVEEMDVDKSGPTTKVTEDEPKISNPEKVEESNGKGKIVGPTIPDELKRKLAEEVEETNEEETSKRRRRRNRNKKRNEAKKNEEQVADDETYAGWMPPQGQSGDGMTKLNDKFGY